MKLKNTISLLLLTVYSIVLAHNFIPHHHHLEDSHYPAFYCQVEEEKEHQDHCCDFSLTDHDHDSHQHQSCNFNEKIVLAKSSGLSVLFLPASPVEYEFSDDDKKIFYVTYYSKTLTDRNCRHILLRGPPQFS